MNSFKNGRVELFFIPRGNKWYARLVQINPFWRYGLTFMSLFVTFSLWFFFIHAAIDHQIMQFRMETESCCRQNKRCNVAQNKCVSLQERIQSQGIKLKQIVNAFPSVKTAQYTDHIITMMANNGLQLVSCTIGSKPTESCLSIKTQGDWGQVQLFLKDLVHKEQSITIEDFILQKNDTQFSVAATISLHQVLV